MPPRIPDDKRAAILADIQAGKLSRNAVARKHQVSVSTVTKIANENGEADAFDRSQTKRATQARVTDLQARRAAFSERLMGIAERVADRLEAPYQVVVSGRDGADIVDLVLPPLGEVRSGMTAIGIALDKSLRLIDFDSGDDGTDGAKGLLRTLGAAMTDAARDLGVADVEEFGA
jgi:transposase-like protein